MTKPHLPVEARLLAALKREMQRPADESVQRTVTARLSVALGPSFGSPNPTGAEPATLTSSAASSTGIAASAAATGAAAWIHPLVVLVASATLGTGALFGIAAIVEPAPGPAAAPASRTPTAPVLPPAALPPAQKRVPPATEPADVSAPLRAVARSPSPKPGAAIASSNPPAPGASLRDQQALLDTARRALARHEGAAALEALAWHRAQFPKTALEEEREALTVKALRDSGRAAEANERAQRFSERYPASVFLPGVSPGLEPIP